MGLAAFSQDQPVDERPVIDFENISRSNRRMAQKAKIALDLLSLLVTLGCLAFALYRSWH
ncbi:MAG: hypothetical protein DMG60_01110 [Acidobacteria bacterium]|nr:MAG: hypothetical protein DMG60_01110 [Acidobacteriota bacterium]